MNSVFPARIFSAPIVPSPQVVAWLPRMEDPHNTREASSDDSIPANLLPLFERLSRDYIPIRCTQTRALQPWRADHPASEMPRTFGSHDVMFGRGTTWEVRAPRALLAHFVATFTQKVTLSGGTNALLANDLLTLFSGQLPA